MPFTPTHILAIVPLAAVRRWRLPFSALAIGSMIPDLPLFVPPVAGYLVTHSVPGLLAADLPLGLAGFLLFQWVLKRPLFALLPAAIQRRCVGLADSCVEATPGFFLRVALAIVVGAFSHLVWDSFTHYDRTGTHLFPALNRPGLTILGNPVPNYKLLQYGCTAVGLPLLMLLLAAWLRRRRPEPLADGATLSPAAKRAACLVALAILVVVVALVANRADLSLHQRLAWVITRSGAGAMLALLAYALVFRVLLRPGPSPPPQA